MKEETLKNIVEPFEIGITILYIMIVSFFGLLLISTYITPHIIEILLSLCQIIVFFSVIWFIGAFGYMLKNLTRRQ